ncbi:MAG: hypothetical protein GXO64_03040 [Candidatus Micrarchaeota archaeon]|nr:hypothetical protein [Candidatus Micrarchaeota archaeon]
MPYKERKKYFELTYEDVSYLANEYDRRKAKGVCERGNGIIPRATPDGKSNHESGWIKGQFSFVTGMIDAGRWEETIKVGEIKQIGKTIYWDLLKAIHLTNRYYQKR